MSRAKDVKLQRVPVRKIHYNTTATQKTPELVQCSYIVRRKQRRCRRFAAAGQTLCSAHQPEALAAERIRCKKAKDQNPRRKMRTSSSQKRMANPFACTVKPDPILPSCFADPARPLFIDVGCAKGNFLTNLAQLTKHAATDNIVQAEGWSQFSSYNFCGVELRERMVADANAHAQERGLDNLHFVHGNINSVLLPPDERNAESRPGLLSLLPPGVLRAVSIQFPSPWARKRHARRRIVTQVVTRKTCRAPQTNLVEACAALMTPTLRTKTTAACPSSPDTATAMSAPTPATPAAATSPTMGRKIPVLKEVCTPPRVFLSSDCPEIFEDMLGAFASSAFFDILDRPVRNPLGLPSAREKVCETAGRPVFRAVLGRNSNPYIK